MSDSECAAFLQWALPCLRLRWAGYRRVRRQVCRRIARRIRELGLAEVSAYRARLEAHGEEWAVLDTLLPVTISRFCRDRGVFERLEKELLPRLAKLALERGDPALSIWSAGCASGEEPYTVAILFRLEIARHLPHLGLKLVATDINDKVLERARRGRYTVGSLKELPPGWIDAAFQREGRLYCVREAMRAGIEFRREDLRESMPGGPFHLVLCRNVAFTYFDEALQRGVVERIAERLVQRGLLVLGNREVLPPGSGGFVPEAAAAHAYRRVLSDPSSSNWKARGFGS